MTTSRTCRERLLAVLLFLLGSLVAGPAAAAEIGPEADLCAEINLLAPGGELVLRPGEYQGPCTIRTGGLPGAPIVIRAQDLDRRPQIVYDRARSNVMDVKADHVVLRGLRFGPTLRGVDGVRVYGGRDVTVEDCEFIGVSGIAVVANHNSVRDLVVRRNVIRDSRATAMYFGCHDGAACAVSGLVVERNYIHTVRVDDPEVGYGIQVKLNSTGAVRDNVVVDAKGPGIMLYGARDLTARSVVERNFVMASARSSGIVIGGGPVVVRNNVALGNAEAGIVLQDYGGRGLLRDVVVTHNTLYDNRGGPIGLPAGGLRGVTVMNNALHGLTGLFPLPPPHPGLRLAGNVACAGVACFVDPLTFDFSPTPGGRLHGAAAVRGEPWAPGDDFFGARRGLPPTVGAIEGTGRIIPMGLKPVP